VKGFRFSFLGARMGLEGLLPYGKEFFIALGGPLVNFLCAGVTWLCPWGKTDGGMLFFYASLGLGLLNMLPVGTLDGGRMLSAALSRLFSPEAAARCVGVTTALCLGSLWILTVYGLLRGAPVVSLSVFFLYLLLRRGMGRNTGDANG
jgi:stage IV sporulation protein FB